MESKIKILAQDFYLPRKRWKHWQMHKKTYSVRLTARLNRKFGETKHNEILTQVLILSHKLGKNILLEDYISYFQVSISLLKMMNIF